MEKEFCYPYQYMSEQKKMTVWVIAKLLSGLKVKDINEILECLKATMEKNIKWCCKGDKTNAES